MATETEVDLEGIRRRVRKLFALSKSPNENEAMAALEKAFALMEEYHLSAGECLYNRYATKATKRLSQWRMVLSKTVAWLNYCEMFRSPETREIVFYGEPVDTLLAGEMYRYLSGAIERMARQNIRKSATKKYREKYRLGIASILGVRIHEMGEKASWAPQRKMKLLAVKRAMENEIDLVSTDVKIKGASGAAFMRGLAAGQGISLNRQTTGHGGRYLEAGT